MRQPTALQQQPRRSNSIRNAPTPLDATGDGKSFGTISLLLLHGLGCLISLVLGFRFSRLVFFLLLSPPSTTTVYTSLLTTLSSQSEKNVSAAVNSRVVVGRHGILIRPWPHPDPTEVMKAHGIIARVQSEQRSQFGVKSPRTVIAVTPTYVRTFQTPHLTGVMHSLMNVPYDVIWIVVEAGGASNETASLIAKSGLRTMHIGFGGKMPVLWEDRHKLESKLRLHALRVVREKRLDGIVMFADDSNVHSLELFDEIQKVKWFGAFSVGILAHLGDSKDGKPLFMIQKEEDEKDDKNSSVPVQGPACNSSNNLVGWHTFDASPFMERSARYVGDRGLVVPKKMEWAGFVLNSRMVWENSNKPAWIKELEEVERDGEDVGTPLALLKDASVVEPLGKCGKEVMLWWLRVEARADSKFPSRWIINPPLDITVPAKRTPWPDAPPELPSLDVEKVTDTQENTERWAIKIVPKRKPRSKRKNMTRALDEHVVSTEHSGQV